MDALLACCGAEFPADDVRYRRLAEIHYAKSVVGLRADLASDNPHAHSMVHLKTVIILCIYEVGFFCWNVEGLFQHNQASNTGTAFQTMHLARRQFPFARGSAINPAVSQTRRGAHPIGIRKKNASPDSGSVHIPCRYQHPNSNSHWHSPQRSIPRFH